MDTGKSMRRNLKRGLLFLVFLTVVSSVIFVTHEYVSLKKSGIIVLLYHRISEHGTGKYVIKAENFEWQMRYLKSHGYKTILPRDAVHNQNINNLSKTIILSFDDGTTDHYATVYPILKRYGLKGVFFVITKYIGSPGSLTAEQIKRMARGGMEFGSHTYSHPFLDELDDKGIYDQLEISKEDLEHIIGNPVISLAPPGGWFDKRSIIVAKKIGYRFLFGCEIGVNDVAENPFVYKRIEVLGAMDMSEFQHILHPPDIIFYKVVQSIKFFVHDIMGSNNYQKLANAF